VNRIIVLLMLMSCLCAADANREQALQGIIQELVIKRNDHTARAEKIGDKELLERVGVLHDKLVAEWQEAVKTGTLAPESSLFKWHEGLKESHAAMQAKMNDKVAARFKLRIDYVEWILGKADPRFDGGQKVSLY
jgi:hypothetical protein